MKWDKRGEIKFNDGVIVLDDVLIKTNVQDAKNSPRRHFAETLETHVLRIDDGDSISIEISSLVLHCMLRLLILIY